MDTESLGLLILFLSPFVIAVIDCGLLQMGSSEIAFFSSKDWDARALLRGGGTNKDLGFLLAACVDAKYFSHGIGTESFKRPSRAMYQIGG
jgi:cyclic pyranopterin phosphate synthase